MGLLILIGFIGFCLGNIFQILIRDYTFKHK